MEGQRAQENQMRMRRQEKDFCGREKSSCPKKRGLLHSETAYALTIHLEKMCFVMAVYVAPTYSLG